VQALPDAGSLPLLEPPPAGYSRAEAELLGQVRPGDSGVQDKEDPLQCLTVGQSLSSWITEASLLPREQRLDQLPQLVRDDPRRGSHRHPSQLDDGCRRASSSPSGSLHSEISSNGSRGGGYPGTFYYACARVRARKVLGAARRRPRDQAPRSSNRRGGWVAPRVRACARDSRRTVPGDAVRSALAPLITNQDRLAGIEAPVGEVGEQRPGDGRGLGRALPEPECASRRESGC
jgi:hypothetical protein